MSNFTDDIKELVKLFLEKVSLERNEHTTGMKAGANHVFYYSDIVLAEITERILNEPKLGKLFSRKDVNATILEFVGSGFEDRENDEKVICKIIKWINSDPIEFTCFIPVHGVEVSNKYKIGDVTLHPFNEKKSILKANLKADMTSFIETESIDKLPFAIIKVNSISPDGAIEVAISEVKSTLNILQFLFNTPGSIYQIGTGKPTQNTGDSQYLALSSTTGIAQQKSRYIPFGIDLSLLSTNETEYLQRVSEIQSDIFNQTKTVPLQNGLFNATTLIGNSLNSEDLTLQLLQLMSAIEALVEQNTFTQGITDQVCERTALLLGADYDSRKKIYDKLSDLYKKRSHLTHGNTASINYFDIVNLWEIAKNLCFYFDQHYEYFLDSNKNEKKNLKAYVLKLRFENDNTKSID
ncbi:hypothetical protein [Leuconostoc citreum]|uniref:hypothetical protein n=1 Tax=Leuconostoc citreum TaxID=33964 RepID=UPI0032E00435